ncbi:hypothetical protein HDV02_000345, partial [Globomyces sp. JEL0801]
IEIALLMGPMKRTASIRATNSCKIYSLSKKDLSVILKENKTMEKKLTRIAEERLAANKPKTTSPISQQIPPSNGQHNPHRKAKLRFLHLVRDLSPFWSTSL